MRLNSQAGRKRVAVVAVEPTPNQQLVTSPNGGMIEPLLLSSRDQAPLRVAFVRIPIDLAARRRGEHDERASDGVDLQRGAISQVAPAL